MRVGFATARDKGSLNGKVVGDLNLDYRLLFPELERLGSMPEAVVWDDPTVDWGIYDTVVVASCWDYHNKAAKYERWLRTLQASGVLLWNPVDAILWNLRKDLYLKDLEERGILLPPTVWIAPDEFCDIGAIMDERCWTGVAVKAGLSASAENLVFGDRDTSDDLQAEVNQLQSRLAGMCGLLVQQVIPEIRTHGEWSLVFFNRQFSHAVRKLPDRESPQEIRVHREFGGEDHAEMPPVWVIDRAVEVLQRVPFPLLYARVDGIATERQFYLMELEINEPSLYLGVASPVYGTAPIASFGQAFVRLQQSPPNRS